MKIKTMIAILSYMLFCFCQSYAQSKPDFTHFGKPYGIVLINNMPFLKLTVGKADGFFVLDFGTNASSLDTNGFDCHRIPHGTVDETRSKVTIDPFDLYGGSFYFRFRPSTVDLPNIKQAGIIGTDLFMEKIYTLDYMDQILYQSDQAPFPSDDVLKTAGFKAVSSSLHYSNDFSKLEDPKTTFNIPTVPIKIGTVTALAQVDPGFNDRYHYHSVNINEAMYEALLKAKIPMIPLSGPQNSVSGLNGGDTLTGYQLAQGYTFSIIATDGTPILVSPNVYLFVKHASAEVLKAAGGIGAWTVPGAQFGASFLKQSKVIIFDPFSSQVWFYTK